MVDAIVTYEEMKKFFEQKLGRCSPASLSSFRLMDEGDYNVLARKVITQLIADQYNISLSMAAHLVEAAYEAGK